MSDISSSAVRQVVKDLGVDALDDLGDEESLFDAGFLDSLQMINLVQDLETRFRLQIEPKDLKPGNFDSIGAMTRFLVQRSADGALT